MLALERLSPLERAAFLLHDVFGLASRRSPRPSSAIRGLPPTHRPARNHVREARPRYEVDKQHGLELAQAFFAASRNGDMKALGAMLAADVSVHADGGGKRPAALRPIVGFEAVMKVHNLWQSFGKNGSKLMRTDSSTACRLHHAGGRRRTPDDRARHRGRQGRRHLCGAQSRQAEASALDGCGPDGAKRNPRTLERLPPGFGALRLLAASSRAGTGIALRFTRG